MRPNHNQSSRKDRDYQANNFSRRDRSQKFSQRPEYDQQHDSGYEQEENYPQHERGTSLGSQADRSFTDYMRDESSHSHTSTPYRPSQDWSSNRPQFDRMNGRSQMNQRNFGSQSYNQHDDIYSSSRDSAQSYQGRFSGMGPKGYKRSDERIREDVCEALARDSELDASNIEVEVKDGAVTLSGSVETRQAKRHAEDCIESLSGVRDITNNIRMEKSSISTTQTNRTSQNPNMMSSTSQSSSSTASTSKKATQ